MVLVDQHPRSRKLSEALKSGAERMGWRAEITDQPHNSPQADMCAAYGWRHRDTFNIYRSAGLDYFYCDLGFWGRKHSGGDYNGYHKCCLNARQPNAYFLTKPRPADRLRGAPEVHPWRSDGKHIVIAGMSAKGAASTGRAPLAWENTTIAALRKITDRPLTYRPKPSWRDARPIHGTAFSPATEDISEVLRGAWALVTCYSNAAVDALAAGIPVYAEEGVSKALSIGSLAEIEDPPAISESKRLDWLAAVGYVHFTRPEIASGFMFDRFRADGLIA